MAVRPLQKVARAKVRERPSSGNLRAVCSVTSQASKTEKSSEVATPASSRPAISTA